MLNPKLLEILPKVQLKISSLEIIPDNGGIPAMANVPIKKVQYVTGIF